MPTLLTDEPSNVDELGGAHAKIANTITTLIRTSAGGQTIRLDGTWGAGKSTVVKMVAEHFDNLLPAAVGRAPSGPTDVAVFQYDAWVHVGDPLRRAFLSALVGRVADKGWLGGPDGPANESFWKTKLDGLSRRLKTTSRKTKPFFSTTAKVILSALAALGIAAPLVSELEKRLVGDLHTAPLLASVVAVGLLAFALIHLLSNEAMGFIVRRNSDEEIVEVREEPEPTSIEFQDAFSELMHAVLFDEARRLVIVVDNLDRIDSDDTKAVWVLLRSFLDNPQFKSQDWFRRLWVIVPVVDEHLVLQSSAPGISPTVDAQAAWPSFLEKVFQLRFTLPPPMLHSWKSYFSAKLCAAFGEDLLGDYDEILRLYEDGGLRIHSNLTPRGIVSFINELVVLKLEWGDKVGISALAAYALSKDRFIGDSCSPPEAMSNILHDDSLVDTFAMLHHRASSKEEASYISVRPRLEAAMDSADSDAISTLFKESPAFQYVLDKYIRQDVAGLDGQQERLLQAVRALRPFIVERHLLSPGTVSHFRRVVLETMTASKNLRLFNANLISGLQALLDVSVTRDKTAALIIEMLRNIDRSAADQTGALDKQISDGWTSWTSALQGVLSLTAVREAMVVEGFERVVLPIGAELWARLCTELRDSAQSWILTSCTCRGSDDAKLGWLAEQFCSGPPKPEGIALLEQEFKTGQQNFFDVVADSVINKAVDTGSISLPPSYDHFLPSLTILFKLDRMRLRPYLQQPSVNGDLAKLLGSSRPRNDWKSATLTYLIIFSTNGELPDVVFDDEAKSGLQALTMMAEGKISLNSDQAKVYAEVLADLEVFEVLTLIANRWGIRGLATSVALALAENERFLQFVRMRGDFDTCLIAFAGAHFFDLTLREKFVVAARQAEATADPNASVDERRSLSDRLQETSIPS
ncbi:P-loop NTPase fold protein [Burkholderia vietnamiensis]|uniref:P-loop NTPase fold protein n=1 Tax=Burkholderia vietnamiensis TaxID=60552 RepID=UPI001CF246D7|nr:P-loop NTPase fold protein [Burkholderia vietnamiensis]MCA8287315.1 KAP family NTPase [Burkholderia vietnamiensis]